MGWNARIWRYSATTGVDAASGSGSVAPLVIDVAPNPFSNAVIFTMRGERGPAALRIFDVAGREIARVRSSDANYMRWDGRDRRGQQVAAGTYFWQLEVPAARMQGKVVLAP